MSVHGSTTLFPVFVTKHVCCLECLMKTYYFLQTLHLNCKFPSRNELHQKEALIKAFENINPREVLLNLTVAKFTNLTLEL